MVWGNHGATGKVGRKRREGGRQGCKKECRGGGGGGG